MVKTILSLIISIIILTCGAIYETDFVKRQFNELTTDINIVYEKVNEQTATKEDVIILRDNWLEKKKYLHAFIPHNEIKEIDLWIFEAITYVDNREWIDASAKLQVLYNLSKEIPKTFAISLENIL